MDGAPAFPAPAFHHIHVNSVDPERALDWWETFWPAGQRTTVSGLPAFEADGVYLLYNTVDAPAPGAFDPELRQSAPQSAFWTTGPSTDGLALYERLIALDPDGERFGFLPVYIGPDDADGVPHSGLAPFGDQLLTVAEMAERAAREGANPSRDRAGSQDFGYLVDPDGILVEFNGNAATADLFYGHLHFWHEQPLCAANWYATHLGAALPPLRDPDTGETRPRPMYDPCAVEIGDVSFPSFLPMGQLRTPIASVRLANAGWMWYSRQCRNGRCGPDLDRPLAPSRGQVVDLPRPRPRARAPGGGRRRRRRGSLSVRRDPRRAHRGPRRAGAGIDRGGFRLSRCDESSCPRCSPRSSRFSAPPCTAARGASSRCRRPGPSSPAASSY